MNTAFTTHTLLSFYAFLDHYLLQEGKLFTNTTQRLFQGSVDPALGAVQQALTAPFRSIVWDHSITGAQQFTGISGFLFDSSLYTSSGGDQLYSTIYFPQFLATGVGGPTLQIELSAASYVTVPTGTAILSGHTIFFPDNLTQTGVVRASGSGGTGYTDIVFLITGGPGTITTGQYGMVMDFPNGRAIFPGNTFPTTTLLSGSFAFKDFNVYFANDMGERMSFTNKPYLNSRFNRALSGVPPHRNLATPCVVISAPQVRNQMKALGGKYDSEVIMRCDVWADTLTQLENALSIIRDSKDLCFPQITTAQWPLQPSGDYKGTAYNYLTLYNSLYTPDNLFSITRVRCMKGGDNSEVDQDIWVGRADMTLQRTRYIR